MDYMEIIGRAFDALEAFSGDSKKIVGIRDYLTQVLAWEPEVVEKDWKNIRKEYASLVRRSKLPRKSLPEL